ncbi:MAG: RNA polymerase sigma factor region1.1 domain-containing protein [Brevefilum sp.]
MSQPSSNSTDYVSPLARLFQLARKQGYLTYDEILAEIPQADLSLEQVDRLFGALITAGIPYGDESAFSGNEDQL